LPESADAAGAVNSTFGQTFAALASRDFRRLWFGVMCMMGGLQMQGIARGYLTYDITGSPVRLGLVNAGFAVPMLILSLFGGAAADRFDRKRVVQVFQGVGGATALIVAFSIVSGSVTWIHLFAASVVNGVIFSFMVPARNALIPQLVGADQVANALALNSAAMSGTTLLAPAAAGLLYAWIGPGGVYFIIAALELAAMVWTGLVRFRADPGERRAQPVLSDILAGLRYIRGYPLVVVLLVMGLGTALLAYPFRSLLPVMIVEVYGRGSEALGLLVSTMGVGAIAGSLTVAALHKRRRGLILIGGALASAIALGLIAAVPVYAVAAGFMVLLGVGDAIRRSLNMALILEIVEPDYRGRVISVYTMNFGLMPLGVVPAGIVAEFFGIRVATTMLAVLMLALVLAMVLGRRDLRRMA
jgi:MFS family permease